ncbi:hypothetical protein CFP65_3183 [Kitasatospora sp. MMS16-BH015]|uniref:SAM-dependent methyltransferase n=1 Tax=Kitasatospora sp. MMS16-BH015 TaxID=2018025 RepID=UPI000CA0B161|nr:SAM-dependent methyltransferase [Kitasatospora sp. MMS16-BH015]AUG77987.1 hypothetical protein CFP65_3183 [Kitasatospora sp. MMS16-BH015]
MSWQRWQTAMEQALYAPDSGFYRRPEGPVGHFRTSVHASPHYAGAVARLLREVDRELGRPEVITLVDVGAGRGELLTGVLAAVGGLDDRGDLGGRLRPVAVEVAERPAGVPAEVEWTDRVPTGFAGLLFANEWLDNVPLDIAEVDEDGVLRLVEVTPAGEERLAAPVAGADAEWAARWWPAEEPGARVELGRSRDAAWRGAVAGLERGLAVAVDYAHTRADRPLFGTLAGFRAGREVEPVPDGSCDVTAHVALDSAAAPGLHSLWTTQRAALRALGVDGGRPPLELASTDPVAYLRALGGAGESAELTDPAGLGGFRWLTQTVRMPVPEALRGLDGWQTLPS